MATPLKNNASTASEQRAGRGASRPLGFRASGRAAAARCPESALGVPTNIFRREKSS
jgi:hypothetical protein